MKGKSFSLGMYFVSEAHKMHWIHQLDNTISKVPDGCIIEDMTICVGEDIAEILDLKTGQSYKGFKVAVILGYLIKQDTIYIGNFLQ